MLYKFQLHVFVSNNKTTNFILVFFIWIYICIGARYFDYSKWADVGAPGHPKKIFELAHICFTLSLEVIY